MKQSQVRVVKRPRPSPGADPEPVLSPSGKPMPWL